MALDSSHGDIEALQRKRLCSNCAEEAHLSEQIATRGRRAKCSFCKMTRRCYTLEQLADRIEQAFEQHYERTADQPNAWQYALLSDRESPYQWERDGEPVIYAIKNAAEISMEAASDIQTILADRHANFDFEYETEFSAETHYQEKGADPSRWQIEWEEFEASLKADARFFNRVAASVLTSVFGGIGELTTHHGRSVLVEAGPDTAWPSLFRARVFQSSQELEKALEHPDADLGSPPLNFAAAGRMNARGISVFYGAKDPLVALAEVRPPVGSQVAVARFDIIRPVKLLDLTAFEGLMAGGSIFDPDYVHRLERLAFLRTLSQRLSRPVMPNDEVFAYLATQAVADFLATDPSMNIDGLIYPSVQAGGEGLNVVLFHKAARVAELEIPAGTKIDVQLARMTEDGWEPDYSVSEELPVKGSIEKPTTDEPGSILGHLKDMPVSGTWNGALEDASGRGLQDPTLRIDTGTIAVHVIKAVRIESEKHDVRRYSWSKEELDGAPF